MTLKCHYWHSSGFTGSWLRYLASVLRFVFVFVFVLLFVLLFLLAMARLITVSGIIFQQGPTLGSLSLGY